MLIWSQPLWSLPQQLGDFNGFKYLVNRKNVSGKTYWRCAVNVITEDGALLRENAMHTHTPSHSGRQSGVNYGQESTRCVEIDRRIETMMQRFEDSVISLTDYLSYYLFGISLYVHL